MRRIVLFTAALLSSMTFVTSFAMAAAGFDRPFPPHAKRGEMRPGIHPEIRINGKPRLLSAGARIWNADNLIELPASLQEGKYVVNYTENDAGEIDRVWMLSREEARQPAPNKR